jgi:hypothetical protein
VGRQLPVYLEPEDEGQLLTFLRTHGSVRLFKSSAASPDEIQVQTFEAVSGYCTFLVWPTGFAWKPTYAQSQTGDFYIRNAGVAPVLEYNRAVTTIGESGRLYWSKDFAGAPEYDVDAFDRWVDVLWRWVRRTARRSPINGSAVWVFPAAASRLRLGGSSGAA